MDLSACVSEECGHGEGGDACATLLSDTLQTNDNKPTYLSACVSEEREHEGDAVVKLKSEK